MATSPDAHRSGYCRAPCVAGVMRGSMLQYWGLSFVRTMVREKPNHPV